MNELSASLRGFTFNNKHNYRDMGVVMHSKSIQSPSKKMIKDSVPFMNGTYDFSTIGSAGEITYNERTIEVVLGLNAINKERLQVMYSDILEWLVNNGRSKLVFDVIKDYYYMAEVESTSTFKEVIEFGLLTITFVAQPFKTGVDYATNNLWDYFNFEEDYLQDSDYDIISNKVITIYNPRMLTTPIINCSSNMVLLYNSITYSLFVGDNKSYGLKLQNGSNILDFTGNGHVKISFRKVGL